MLLPGMLVCAYALAIELSGYLNGGRNASFAGQAAVAALVGTPLFWVCILRRDAINAAQRRARAANSMAAASTSSNSTAYRHAASSRPSPSAPTSAETGYRAASGALRNDSATASASQHSRHRAHHRYRQRTPVPAHANPQHHEDSRRPPTYNPAGTPGIVSGADDNGASSSRSTFAVMDEAPVRADDCIPLGHGI